MINASSQYVTELVQNTSNFGSIRSMSLQWRHNGRDGVSNQRRLDCLHNCLFRRRSKKTWKLRVTGLCEGNSPVTGEFPAQSTSNAGNVSIWWRHHVVTILPDCIMFTRKSLKPYIHTSPIVDGTRICSPQTSSNTYPFNEGRFYTLSCCLTRIGNSINVCR